MSPASEPPYAVPGPRTGYDVLVPVKPPHRAKTRLQGHPRAELARAFALDAVTAALAASSVRAVHLVSDDPGLAERRNLEDLPRYAGAPLLGRVPAGAARLAPDEFRAQAPNWIRGLR